MRVICNQKGMICPSISIPDENAKLTILIRKYFTVITALRIDFAAIPEFEESRENDLLCYSLRRICFEGTVASRCQSYRTDRDFFLTVEFFALDSFPSRCYLAYPQTNKRTNGRASERAKVTVS